MSEEALYKTKTAIYEHKNRVSKILLDYVSNLLERSTNHDNSKLQQDELGPYSMVIDEFRHHSFGTEGYKQVTESIAPAIQLHKSRNRHHPEYHELGINDMDLVDLLEMLADWKAATENPGQTNNLMHSISVLSEKYKINPQLVQIMINTANNFKLYQ